MVTGLSVFKTVPEHRLSGGVFFFCAVLYVLRVLRKYKQAKIKFIDSDLCVLCAVLSSVARKLDRVSDSDFWWLQRGLNLSFQKEPKNSRGIVLAAVP